MSRENAEIIDPYVWPVKGMQGIRLDKISVRSVSVVGDRRVAFTEVDTDNRITNTLLDTTKFPGLLRYSPRFCDPSNPKESDIVITTPQGTEVYINDPVLLEQISDESKRKLALLKMGRAAYHSMPVSLVSLGTTREIERLIDEIVDPRAYRQNLYIETTEEVPYEEDRWLGKLIVFGNSPNSAKVVAVKLDPRCATVNYHPQTGESNPNILKAIVKNHNNTLGIYCAIVGEGTIEANSPVYVIPLNGSRQVNN